MKVVAVYNLKGGVGKTATAVNLSWLAARAGLRTLLWDLDPQGAASFYLRVSPELRNGPRRLAAGSYELDPELRATDQPNLDLLPADFRLRKLDAWLAAEQPRTRLAEALHPLREVYDLVVLDCPPSLGRLAENVFEAADALLVPLIPTTLSVRTLDQVSAHVAARGGREVPLLPFFTQADPRKRLHAEVIEALPARYPTTLRTIVPYATQVERMGVERRAVEAFAPRCKAAEAYRALWAEVWGRVGG